MVYAGGPGDIVAGAAAWWGLRAYTEASIGANAVRLRRDSDDAEQDFVTVTGTGGLDLSAISAFKGGGNLFVRTLYDQTGNGFDVGNTSTTAQPPFTLNGLGSLPIITFNRPNAHFLFTSADFGAQAQPGTISAVANHPTGSTQQSLILISNIWQLGYRATGNNQVFLFGGSAEPSATASDDNWHSLHAIFSGTSSDLNVDGSSNIVSGGTAGTSAGTNSTIGGLNASTQLLTGSFVEGGVWLSAFSGANMTDMSAQQHAYWGF